jgi:hypothetical protein
MDGDSIRGEDMLLMASGSGHVSLPAGVRVRMTAGSVKPTVTVAGDCSEVVSSIDPSYHAPPPDPRDQLYRVLGQLVVVPQRPR